MVAHLVSFGTNGERTARPISVNSETISINLFLYGPFFLWR